MSQSDQTPSGQDDTLAWGKSAPTRDLTGVTLGDFHVERLLGKGGMGEVYLARQASLNNREVALKVLRPDLLANPTYLSRFEAEAWSAAKLNHPNIVHIYSVGSTDGIRYIAMEYVQGTNLRDYIIKKGPPELNLALSIMRQATAAVGAAGELGLIHRDIKPENMLITRKGLVKVADFGLCRDQDRGAHLTQDGVTMGTPLYMSPEQAQGHPLDHRSDLYSLGVSFYHMLAGVPPFKAESPVALALKHVKDIPPALSIHRPDIAPELERLVMKLMSKRPADRYQSAAEMLKDLAKIREALMLANTQAGRGVEPNGTNPAPATPSNPDQATLGSRELAPTPPRRRLGAILSSLPLQSRRIAGLILVGACGLGIVSGLQARPRDLLGEKSPPGDKRPALWMAPDWKAVPRQATAAAQYRFAQTLAPAGEREAAWIAVPGYFPEAHEWSSRAYTQLARTLFRMGDVARLKILSKELSATGRGLNQQLAQILDAAEDSLKDKDAEGVALIFTADFIRNMTDIGQVELSLEILARTNLDARAGGRNNSVTAKLRSTQGQLLAKLLEIKRIDGLGPM